MSQASEHDRRIASTRAAVAVMCTALFAVIFAGCMFMLVRQAPATSSDDTIAVGSEVRTDPFYVLLIGSDSRKGTALYTGQAKDESQTSQFADIITLMRVDPSTFTITLVTIPRDTVLTPNGNKVNEALLSDNPKDVVTAVYRLTGVRADYYMMTTFISFENLINAMGGINVDVPVTVTVDDPSTGKMVTVKAGKNQHLNGSQALALARARHEYPTDSDAFRQCNVRNIEEQIIRKALTMDESVDLGQILGVMAHDTETDMNLSDMGRTILEFVNHADEVKFYQGTGLYKGSNRKSDGQWVVLGDDETWSQLMEIVDKGEDPAQFVEPPHFNQ